MDEFRVKRGQCRSVETRGDGRSDRVGFDQEVRATDQFTKCVHIGSNCSVDHDAAFPTCEGSPCEGCLGIVPPRDEWCTSPRLDASWRLNLDHISPEIAKHLSAHATFPASQVEYAIPVKWLSHEAVFLVG